MDRNSKRVEFLKQFVSDIVAGHRQSYAEYAEMFDESNGQIIRKWWRTFKDIYYPKGEWFTGYRVEADWVETINDALTKVGVEIASYTDSGVPLPYENVYPSSVREVSSKEGTKLIHSYKFPKISGGIDLKEFEERLVGALKDSLKEVKPYVRPQVSSNNSMLLNIYTADKHIGADTKGAIFGNQYSAEEFERRMDQIIPTVKEYVDRFGVFEQINVIDLGDGTDGLDGQTSRKGHVLDQNLDNIGQYESYIKAHKRFFDELVAANLGLKIRAINVTNDNHNGFFSYITARGVEEYLNAKYPFIETRVENNFIFHEEFGIHRFILTHGKDFRICKFGMPFKLNKKTEDIINDYIGYNKLDSHLDYEKQKHAIHLIKGDLHQTGSEWAKRFRYKNVLSMYGASNYIQLNYGNSSKGFEFEIFKKDTPEIISGIKFFYDV